MKNDFRFPFDEMISFIDGCRGVSFMGVAPLPLNKKKRGGGCHETN